jgi:glycosyltransferase involved in cell wall biosynthesis
VTRDLQDPSSRPIGAEAAGGERLPRPTGGREATRLSISAVIAARNEAHNIGRCLESLRWADEVVVVDSGSTDGTKEIVRHYQRRLIEGEWLGYGRTKRLAVDSATHDWILSIDADEVVSESLRDRILSLLSEGPRCSGYRIPFRNFYLGHRLRHSGVRREHHLRFFDRRKGNYTDRELHESVRLEGSLAEVTEPILHYSYPTIASHLLKMNRYSDLGAHELHAAGKRATLLGAAVRGVHRFLRMYVFNLGFLDGKHGFLFTVISAFGVYMKYAKLWELGRSRRSS